MTSIFIIGASWEGLHKRTKPWGVNIHQKINLTGRNCCGPPLCLLQDPVTALTASGQIQWIFSYFRAQWHTVYRHINVRKILDIAPSLTFVINIHRNFVGKMPVIFSHHFQHWLSILAVLLQSCIMPGYPELLANFQRHFVMSWPPFPREIHVQGNHCKLKISAQLCSHHVQQHQKSVLATTQGTSQQSSSTVQSAPLRTQGPANSLPISQQ